MRVLEKMLTQWNWTNIVGTTDPHEARPLYQAFQPDIILLDLMMPEMDGFQVMEQLKPMIPHGTYLPILVLTADTTPQTKLKALVAGAKDFLTKPFDAVELSLRIRHLIEARFLHLQLQNQNVILEERVHERTQDLEKAQREILAQMEQLEEAQTEMLGRLAQASEWRDDETGEHTQRVATIAMLLAQGLGLPEDQVDLIRRTAPLHDLGKIGVPDSILLKPGKLTAAEYAVMRDHTSIGSLLLSKGHSALVQMAESIARTHHERWDGTGYPQKLAGDDIPIEGRIVAVADVFDALTHERPYKNAWPLEEAVAEIANQSGRQFDPRVVEAFLTLAHATLL
ncbi:MAG: response regulator [Armatimonadota bacterium]|nr:response regulator [Armatimonadota bacterium]